MTFNFQESERRKFEGMAAASSWPFDQPIHRARNIAIMLAKMNGHVCADDVYKWLEERLPEVLAQIPANGWGSIFNTTKLKFSGKVKQSERVSRHTGIQRLWEYNAIQSS